MGGVAWDNWDSAITSPTWMQRDPMKSSWRRLRDWFQGGFCGLEKTLISILDMNPFGLSINKLTKGANSQERLFHCWPSILD